MRKQRAMTSLLAGLLALGLAIPVHAETFYGDENWNVAFTPEKEMASTFTTADINDVVSGMQPGDNVIITLKLQNTNPTATDWYMQNEVLYSLEDRSANSQTGGGAYTYRLVYTDTDGEVNVLFDSDTVGGESAEDVIAHMGEGLHGATNALKDYFYLDTIYNGQGGTITLEVALDGETQGNDYQDTLADLQMEFAVELREDLPDRPGEPNQPGQPDKPNQPGSGNPPENVDDTKPNQPTPGRGTGVVRTSDDSNLPLYLAISGVTGTILLIYCIYCFREHRKRKKEA